METLMNPFQGLKQTGFIFKVLVISAGLSILIKYGGSKLAIPPTLTNLLIVVLLPTVVMAIALGGRYVLTSAESERRIPPTSLKR